MGLLGAGNQEEGFVGEAAYLGAYLSIESVIDLEQPVSSIRTYLEGNLTCQAGEQSLEEVLEEAAAYLDRVSTRYSNHSHTVCFDLPAGNPGGIPPGGIGNPGGMPAGGIIPPGGPNPGGAVFNIGLFADWPSAAYEFVMLSMTLCAFSCPICW